MTTVMPPSSLGEISPSSMALYVFRYCLLVSRVFTPASFMVSMVRSIIFSMLDRNSLRTSLVLVPSSRAA